jgi:hypothetical protein
MNTEKFLETSALFFSTPYSECVATLPSDASLSFATSRAARESRKDHRGHEHRRNSMRMRAVRAAREAANAIEKSVGPSRR